MNSFVSGYFTYLHFTFMHLADAFIQSDLQRIQVTVLHFISSYHIYIHIYFIFIFHTVNCKQKSYFRKGFLRKRIILEESMA